MDKFNEMYNLYNEIIFGGLVKKADESEEKLLRIQELAEELNNENDKIYDFDTSHGITVLMSSIRDFLSNNIAP